MCPNEEKYKKAIKEYYSSNATMTDLSLKYNFDRSCFSNYLKTNGYKKKKIIPKRPVELYEEAKEYYIQHDISIEKLSKKFKISSKSFSLYLKENNITIKNPVKHQERFFDEDFFKTIDTEQKAYWLGFLFADGCIRNNGKNHQVVLELCKADKFHLDKFIKDLKSNLEIHYRKNRDTGTIRISSKKMVNDLIRYGCIPNKTNNGFFSKDLLEFDITLKNAFIRGFFDGDGYVDKKRYRIILTLKSSSIMESLHKMLIPYGCKIVNEKSYYRLVIENKKGYYDFLDDIYSNATVFLDRKYEIYINRRALLNSTTTEDLGKQGGKSKEA